MAERHSIRKGKGGNAPFPPGANDYDAPRNRRRGTRLCIASSMSFIPRAAVLRSLGLVLTLLVLIVTPARAAPAGSAPFQVQFGEKTVEHRIMTVLTMPDAPVRLAVTDATSGVYRVEAPGHTVTPLSEIKWRVRPPNQPGLHPLTVTNTTNGASVRLQIFVLSPWDHEGRSLNGYRIGTYEETARDGRERYEPPEGFVRVTDANRDARVSPNFRLHQFLCKQTEDTPQYALVRPRLLRTLEAVLAAVNERGHDAPTLHVMSGFRTPYYNRAIGNTTEYSRHLYGDAADIFVDTDGDGRMDDLTGDGRVTEADAKRLANIVARIPTEGRDTFVGGLSTYAPASHRGPFVHLDLRGTRARW